MQKIVFEMFKLIFLKKCLITEWPMVVKLEFMTIG